MIQLKDLSEFGVVEFFVIFAALMVYFIPSWIAGSRNHPNSWPIFIVNLFLGWTYIGWVIALAWASSKINNSRK
jgi:hypothetical protein